MMSHIVEIEIIEDKGMERITIWKTSLPKIVFKGEDAIKYMTSLKAFLRIYGENTILEYAIKRSAQES